MTGRWNITGGQEKLRQVAEGNRAFVRWENYVARSEVRLDQVLEEQECYNKYGLYLLQIHSEF